MSKVSLVSNSLQTMSFTSYLGLIPSAVVEKPLAEITLANLLQCSPDISKSKRFGHSSLFDIPGTSGSSTGGTSSDFLNSSSLIFNKNASATSSSSHLNFESPKLAILDQPNFVEAIDIKGKRKLRKMKKDEREKTKGAKWFNMEATELTQERKNDLEALRLRGALDTKRFYKRNNIVSQPKYFQVGKIVEGAADYYNSRVPKRQRKKTFADEMVAEITSTSHL